MQGLPAMFIMACMRQQHLTFNSNVIILILFSCQFIYPATCYSATVFKCLKNGHTVFSDKPCEGVKNEKVYINENFTEGESLRPDELKMLKEIEEKEKKTAEETAEQQAPEEPVKNTAAQNQAKPEIDEEACKEATEDLKQWQRIMSLGYPPEEAKDYAQTYKNKSDAQQKSCGITQ